MHQSWRDRPESKRGGSIWYGLTLSEFDPSDEYLVCFVDAVFRDAILRDAVPYMADSIAAQLGRNSLTFQEYLIELESKGVDTKKMHERALELRRSFEESVANDQAKAAKFFDLMKTQWIVSDTDVQELVDSQSIYHLVELVLEHTDSARARMKAVKRHKENHAMQRDVFAWLDVNMRDFKSMDAAAGTIAGSVAPIAFRTARDWVGKWKKLRSAGTPYPLPAHHSASQ